MTSEEIREQVGRNIADARKRARLTQHVLGYRAGMRQPDICRLEMGHYSPYLKTLVRLARALELPPADLLADVE
jgi:transcriptional regulator with XRE-family HTH domain